MHADLMVRQLCAEARRRAPGAELARVSFGPLVASILGVPSPALSQMASHLLPSALPADLQFAVLDGVLHGPPPAWNLPHAGPAHLERLHVSADGAVLVQYDPDRRFWWLLDRDAGFGALWTTDLSALPDWERVAPFRILAHWALLATQFAVVHAGAVQTGERALLLVGPGGSGKSTTVVSAALAGLPVFGDDLVAIGPDGERFVVMAMHDAVKIAPDSPVHPMLAASGDGGDMASGKSIFRLSEVTGRPLAAPCPVGALLAVEVGRGTRSEVVPESPSAMLKALAPSTVFLLRGGEHDTVRKVSRLVRSLPCFRLRVGPDPAEVAAQLDHWGRSLS
jgi:hypothetical protein